VTSEQGRPLCWNCESELYSVSVECPGCKKTLDPKERIGLDPEVCVSCQSNLCDGICLNGCGSVEVKNGDLILS
jgi:hypothetical protein